ncbi:triphosphoribosyl-dephospho-CoA synthase MdcB [Acidovorax sp. SUPP1855]|uniref:triphosphoribosyl-dephospho-CoA synthase MdcB n=1 Tax=Acidovorax sp. SUPP1855 TaxID=431774 RepID=UPI0023DE67D6|nr:triphosphoribosyl-dephospho-CoA synthase MdcB [Acidovorax sp. SUPP1855]GKS83543.1 triphosphoribosyl-dephospho-CoA synthase MdcB [Acidovorax sp. SUPP1855]
MTANALRRPASAPGPGPAPHTIGRAATLSLYDELALSPKPGLVTLTDNGSHTDMDARTFMRSLFALRGYFVRIAALGHAGEGFPALERCGIEAEARMVAATGGVNTHRGAIFTLGLLCAAAGALAREGTPLQPAALREALRRHWGAALAERAERTLRTPRLPGGIAAARHGLRGAAQEAALGFPVLFDTAVPALRHALARGLGVQQARVDTLFSVMAVLDDSNLAHRGGLAGLRHAQACARDFLAAGGAGRPGGLEAAHAIGRDFVARRLSPGGSADLLAAACWVVRMAPPAGCAP